MNYEELMNQAANGDAAAQRELARLYESGEELSEDVMIAAGIWHSMLGDTLNEEPDEPEEDYGEADEEEEAVPYEESYEELKSLPTFRLRQMGEDGNLMALAIRGMQFVESDNESEVREGIHQLKGILPDLQTLFMDDSNYRSCLADVFVTLGAYYEKGAAGSSGDYASGLAEKAFNAYSSAAEIDPSKTEHLAHCYEEGIGTPVNKEKAQELRESSITSQDIFSKMKYALDYIQKGLHVKGEEMLHMALASEDAEGWDNFRCIARYFLSLINAVDEDGGAISQSDARQEVSSYVAEGDPLTIYFLHFAGREKQFPGYMEGLQKAVTADPSVPYVRECRGIQAELERKAREKEEAARRAEEERAAREQARIRAAEEEAKRRELEKERMRQREAVRKQSDQEYQEMKKLPPFQLKQMEDQGNLMAQAVRALQYVGFGGENEVRDGVQQLEKLLPEMHTAYEETGSYGQCLADVFVCLGKFYEQRFRQNYGKYDDPDAVTAFEAYSCASEIDPAASSHLIRCYEYGIGTPIDQKKALDLREAGLGNSSIFAKMEFALDCVRSGRQMKGDEWLYAALSSPEISGYYNIRSLARYLLSSHNAPDEKGAAINLGESYQAVKGYLEQGDPLTAFYLYKAGADSAQKAFPGYLECVKKAGDSGIPGTYTEECKKIYTELLKKAEEEAKLKEEQRIAEEQEKARLEKLEKEEARKRERQLMEQKYKAWSKEEKKKTCPRFITLMILPAVFSVVAIIFDMIAQTSILKELVGTIWVILALGSLANYALNKPVPGKEYGLSKFLAMFGIESAVVFLVLRIILRLL